MWFTRTADGFRGWFRAATPSGKPRTGLIAADVSLKLVDPPNAVSSTLSFTESLEAGLYFFDIATGLLTSGGTGQYGVHIVVDTKGIGGSGPPHVTATDSQVLGVTVRGFEDIPTPTEIRVAMATYVLEGNTLGLTWEASLNLIRKILNNRLELADGSVANWVLFDDDDTTTLLDYDVTDVSGVAIVSSPAAPARRTRGT